MDRPKISTGVFDAISSYFASTFSDYLFVSGLSLSASRYFEIDCGLHSVERLISLAEQISCIPNAKPLIADMDDSFGDYTLSGQYGKKLVMAGYYGVVVEDQGRPRKCGHLSGKNLNSLHKYIDGLLRLRDSCPNLFIVARTDAETPEDIDERLSALLELSTDNVINAIQVDGMRSIREISNISRIVPDNLKFVANHVDGGKLNACTLSELKNSGVDILTLSTFILFSYISNLSKLKEIIACGNLPEVDFKLSQLDEILKF